MGGGKKVHNLAFVGVPKIKPLVFYIYYRRFQAYSIYSILLPVGIKNFGNATIHTRETRSEMFLSPLFLSCIYGKDKKTYLTSGKHEEALRSHCG